AAFSALPVPEQLETLLAFGLCETKLGRHSQGSKHFRTAADLPSLPSADRLSIVLMSFDANDHLADKTEARRDLARLDDLLVDARKTIAASPSDVAALNELEKTIKRHHARLGS